MMKTMPVAKPNMTKRKSMIAVRNGFSDEKGFADINHQLQLNEFDDRTRMILSNRLFTALEIFFSDKNGRSRYDSRQLSHLFCGSILSEVFMERTALAEGHVFVWRAVFDRIHDVIMNAPYNEVLDIMWFISSWLKCQMETIFPIFCKMINDTFETECVGYRFVDGRIVAITDQEEIDTIEKATLSGFVGCRTHISNAVGFLADREKKDYKNCVKESISAVEAECNLINGRAGTLKEILNELEKNKKVNIHPALREAFIKLYGYTGDGKGIRHAGQIGGENASFAEAEFMLISCSAFVNYLRCNIAD